MPDGCAVLIAAADLLPILKERWTAPDLELLTFSETEALRALEVITHRRPQVVTLERTFAATPRGAALVNRIKADPTLNDAEIRIVGPDAECERIPPRRIVVAVASTTATSAASAAPAASPAAIVSEAPPAAPLDYRGTRRAKRFRLTGTVNATVDGNAAQIVDLSTMGAQVISPASLRPNQRVRMTLPDETGTVRFNAVVTWASFEMPSGVGARYRAGLEFVDADPSAVDAFIGRHSA